LFIIIIIMTMPSLDHVPVLDLSSDNLRELITTLDAALRQYGFLYIKNHGIDASLLEQQFQVAADLFSLPRSVKEAMPFDGQLDIGYVGSGGQALDSLSEETDSKEQFMMTNNRLITSKETNLEIDPDDVFAGSQNYDIPQVSNHKSVTQKYMSAVYKLNMRLNELLFQALNADEETRRLSHQPFGVLKQMKYAPAANNQIGAGAHTDWGSFTILATDETPGLEIYYQDKWLPVPPKDGCLIVNSGNQIAQLTNNVYQSALHRVVVQHHVRFSTAAFFYFSLHDEVAPLAKFVSDEHPAQYPYGRTSLQYFHYKLHESFGCKSYQEV
jgi:isopenicillin N synthase-like dioxygenase